MQCNQKDVEQLWAALEAEPGSNVTVDLREKTLRAKDFSVGFDLDDYTRWRLLEGLDDIALTLRQADAISEFEQHRPHWKPTTIPA